MTQVKLEGVNEYRDEIWTLTLHEDHFILEDPQGRVACEAPREQSLEVFDVLLPRWLGTGLVIRPHPTKRLIFRNTRASQQALKAYRERAIDDLPTESKARERRRGWLYIALGLTLLLVLVGALIILFSPAYDHAIRLRTATPGLAIPLTGIAWLFFRGIKRIRLYQDSANRI